jgi:hypothetical protein
MIAATAQQVCNTAACAVALVFFLPPWQEGGGTSGKKFTSAKGRFSVVLPGAPKEAKQTINGINNYVQMVELGERGTFAVSYFDIPPKTVLTLETSVAAYAKALKGKVLTTKKKVLADEYPGREVLIQLPGNQFTRLGVYIVRERYYQVIVSGSRQVVGGKAADTVFSSFRLEE